MLKSKKGITLIALIITIIVLLILAGITIALVVGDNGVLSKAKKSSQDTIVGREKETIALSWNAVFTNQSANGVGITDDIFEQELKNNNNDVTVSYDEDRNFIVHFNDTGHNYVVNNTGKINEYNGVVPEEVVEQTDIYVTLYTDGTLGFCSTEAKIEGKTVSKEYGKIQGREYGCAYTDYYDGTTDVPWFGDRESILKVDFVDEIAPTSTACWFYKCQQLEEVYHIQNLNTQLVTDMSWMFFACLNLKTIDVSGFNTKNVTDMLNLFSGGYMGIMQLKEIRGLENFRTSKVTDMNGMFFRCGNLTSLNVSSFDTSNVTDMESMFNGCTKLTSIDVSNFNTSNVTNMSYMFCGHYEDTVMSLQEIRGLENFNTENVIQMQGMFARCTGLTVLNLSSFNTIKVTDIYEMFRDSNNLVTIYVSNGWDMQNVTNSIVMFQNCSNLIGGNGTSFSTSYTDKTYARIDKAGQAGYFTDISQNLASNNIELEYIESTGTQYIKTGFIPNQDTAVETEYSFSQVRKFIWFKN